VNYFLTQKLSWNLINRFPHHSFRWTGIDGSTVPTHMLPEDTYNGPAMPRSLLKVENDYAQRDVSNHSLLCYGIGDGGGGPGAEHLERIARVKKMDCLPDVYCESTAAFISKWSKDADKFPEYQGELYLERHQGTLTTQAKTKKYNRQAELALRELEWLATAAEVLHDVPYPSNELETIWKEILLYQFHDILPGSSIQRVYTECNERYQALLAEVEQLAADRRAALSNGRTIFNSSSWPRKEWIKDGSEWLYAEAPASGLATIHACVNPTFDDLSVEPIQLENHKLRITFADDGTIRSLFDKEQQKEVAAGPVNRLAVYDDLGDAWDIPLDYRETAPEAMMLVSSETKIDGPCAVLTQVYTYKASTLTQHIILKTNSALIEFETTVDWKEPRKMLRAEFPIQISAREATYDIPFGFIRRPTHDDTSWDKAKDEVAAHQWCDLSQADYGVSLINDCKYGHRIKGNCIEINLLRSVPYPGLALIDSGDQSESDSQSECGDLERHSFRYALYPHADDPLSAGTIQCAREFNQPLRITGTGDAQEQNALSLLSIDNPRIELTCLKKAEDRRGIIVRLCNITDQPQQTAITPHFPQEQSYETNLMEEEETDAIFPLNFAPFEIKSLRIT
jgi:alpha-mannosidase